MRRDVRGRSLNGIRQICDAADRFHGMVWIFTGTPEFFDTKRGVALKLREMYPTGERDRQARTVSSSYLDALVKRVSAGFGGDVGVVPRQFLRQFVNVLDLVAEHPQYDPGAEDGGAGDDGTVVQPEFNETERRLAEGRRAYDPEPEDETAYRVEF